MTNLQYYHFFNLLFGYKLSSSQLASVGFGKPSKNHSFTREAEFDHVLLILFKSGYSGMYSISVVCMSHPLYDHLFILLHRCAYIDFEPLRVDDPNYDDQTSIPHTRKVQALSAALFYDLHIPSVIRYWGGARTWDNSVMYKRSFLILRGLFL